jgi:hypothetical protein
MRKLFLIATIVAIGTTIGCRAGKGCPSNGKNIGAERLLSGDLQALKAAKKAGKFKH